MFAIPQILLHPVLSGFGSGTVASPTVALVLAWLLVAALVGSLLGILREAAGNTRAPEDTAELDRSHPEAA